MRIGGLDSIRFICALTVAAEHCGLFNSLVYGLHLNWTAPYLLPDIEGTIGEAAVIVFFIISGFCISFPFRHGTKPDFRSYLLRREIRILPPCISSIMVALLLGVSYFPLDHSNLWSIICEEIYYVLFPLMILPLRLKLSWLQLIAIAQCAAIAVIATHPFEHSFHAHGAALTWIVGYPAWLWGCHLSSKVDEIRKGSLVVSSMQIWLYRLGVGAYMVLAGLCNHFTPIDSVISLSLFAPIIYLWLSREIAYGMHKTPLPALEWAGKWSYSLYLIHLPLGRLGAQIFPPSLGPFVDFFGWTFVILVGSWLFYIVMEQPSHRWARRITEPRQGTATVAVTT